MNDFYRTRYGRQNKPMIQTLTKSEDQYLVKGAVTWEQFKTLQSAFAEIGGVRTIYCEGVLEIVGTGRLHEMTVALLGLLLGQFFVLKRIITFVSTGSYTQELKGITEFQADLSYNFGIEKEVSDLCIEVVVTSGNQKLRKYQLLGVPEVWFWQDGKIDIYILQDDKYEKIEVSRCLPDLDIRHLEECLLMDSQLESILAFQNRYQKI